MRLPLFHARRVRRKHDPLRVSQHAAVERHPARAVVRGVGRRLPYPPARPLHGVDGDRAFRGVRRAGHQEPRDNRAPRRQPITPAGADWVFDEDDLEGGLTTYVGPIGTTGLVMTVDDGPDDHAVRVINPTLIGSGKTPVTGVVGFYDPQTLNSAAAFVPPSTLYVATDDGVIQALTVDTTTGSLTRTDSASIMLPPGQTSRRAPPTGTSPGSPSSPDATRLVATSVFSQDLLVYDVTATSSTRGKLLGTLDLGANETFQVSFDPNDATGQYVYVSMWANKEVLEVDVSNPATPQARPYVRDRHGSRGRRVPRRALDGRRERPGRHALDGRPRRRAP